MAELRERRDGGVGARDREAGDERCGDEAGQQQEGVQEERLVRVRVRVRVRLQYPNNPNNPNPNPNLWARASYVKPPPAHLGRARRRLRRSLEG